MRSHQGPSSTTMAATTSTTPPSGRSESAPRVPGQQQDQAADQQQARDRGTRDDRRSPAAAGQAQFGPPAPSNGSASRRIDLLLLRGGVSPDQREAGQADDQRPAPGCRASRAEHGGEDEHDDQQRTEGGRERDAPPVGQRLARDIAVLAGHRYEKPGQDVDRGTHADQRGQNEHYPHDHDVDARPRGQAGRHPAEETVVPPAPQRPAVPGPRDHSREVPVRRRPPPSWGAVLRKICPRTPSSRRGGPPGYRANPDLPG